MNKIKNIGQNIRLEQMLENETNLVVNIISCSMNKNEGRWARKTIKHHFFDLKNNYHDGRLYYAVKIQNKIIGICGLHNYVWGPEDVTWLGWFAVAPKHQRKGIGHIMMKKTFEIARKKGFRCIFVETYTGKDFISARNFYEKFGFKKAGQIKGYINQGKEDMVIYGKNLAQ